MGKSSITKASGAKTAITPALAAAAQKAAEFVRDSIPENTKRAYMADWSAFSEWCRVNRAQALPADPRVVAAFIASESSRLRPSSLRRRLASITKMHRVSGHASPCGAEPVPSTIKGIEARFGAMVAAKAPATREVVEKMVATCRTDTFDGIRNRAILLVGYAGAFRRSELVALNVEDLEWSNEGVVITVRRSKTDQRGEGKRKAIPFVPGHLCAAKALKAWLEAGRIFDGPIFRPMARNEETRYCHLTPQSVALIIKGAAKAAGLPPGAYSGHSLRAGHVTEARAQGVSDADTMSLTGHKRIETLNMYDRRNNLFSKTSAAAVLSGKK